MLLLLTNLPFVLLYRLTERDSPAFELLFATVDALIVFHWYRRDAGAIRPLLKGTGFNSRNWWLPIALFAGAGLLVVPYFLLVERLGGQFLDILPDYLEHGWPLWSAYLMVCLVPAIVEEVAFRGVIQTRLQKVLTSSEALILQAIFFSVLHLFPINFPSHFVMGLAFGLVRQRTGSLYPGMVMHAIWNAGVLVQEQVTGINPG